MKKSEPRKPRSLNQTYAIYAGVGLSVATEIIVLGLVGNWLGGLLDKRWGTTPWLGVVGVVLFLALAIFHGVRMLMRVQARMEREEQDGL